jgi:hypothetical protein
MILAQQSADISVLSDIREDRFGVVVASEVFPHGAVGEGRSDVHLIAVLLEYDLLPGNDPFPSPFLLPPAKGLSAGEGMV